MVDDNKQHEPVLLPEDEGKVKRENAAKKRGEEPILLSEDHRERKEKPPYILVFFIIFGLLTVFWKIAFYGDEIKEHQNSRVDYTNEELIERALSKKSINPAMR